MITPTYVSWSSMKQRCGNPKKDNYRFYGGRGITVCERWHKFANFLADMGERPSRLHTLDRIKGDGNYEPGNCRWALKVAQANNTRSTTFLTHGNLRLPLREWARRIGVSPITLQRRIKYYGWSADRAVTTPVRRARK